MIIGIDKLDEAQRPYSLYFSVEFNVSFIRTLFCYNSREESFNPDIWSIMFYYI